MIQPVKIAEDHNLLDVVNYLVKDVDEGEVTTLPSHFDLNIDERATAYSEIEGLSSNVKNFLESEYLFKEGGTIHFVNQNFLPDRKVVILSASAHVNFYKEVLNPDRFLIFLLSKPYPLLHCS